MPDASDGPNSPLFKTLDVIGNQRLDGLAEPLVSKQMADSRKHAPEGDCTGWGIPFKVGRRIVLVKDRPVTIKTRPFASKWLLFLHTSDVVAERRNAQGLYDGPVHGEGVLNRHAADYVILYADGTEERQPIRQRHQVGMCSRQWGANCFQAVAQHKPYPVRAHHEQMIQGWGWSQTRAIAADMPPWVNWIYPWENPHPSKRIVGFRFEPVSGGLVLSAISYGNAQSNPVLWKTRRKAIFVLPKGTTFDPTLDKNGLLAQIRLDLGQVISATPRPLYPNNDWAATYNNKVPEISRREILVEYTAHPEARFHLAGGRSTPVARLQPTVGAIRPVAPATQRVTIRAIEKGSRKPVPVKLHLHGEAGEYLAPTDRHRIPNAAWFEDYSVDFSHKAIHHCTYIPGETDVDLPIGKVYLEISKGFEIRPIRKVIRITRAKKEIVIPIETVLPWREKGWVTADTHVHFLSPQSALLEGAGEGVNVVNLLASQWGELMTNVGDFDGRTTFGAKEAGGDGEHLVRVGTENRQHVLGHISLLGYDGRIIAPMTTGGPDESALGDPIGILLTEWARQCRRQGGIVVIPHFPNPRAEHAATIVSGNADGVEMTAWGNLYAGIDPYSLCDWYRYLNCGYFVAAVAGTDKMFAHTAVGAIRTYANLRDDRFTYDAWKEAVRRGHTFVTYGPLMEVAVEGKPPGSRIRMSRNGGTVDVTWKIASVTVPMTRVELIVNGEVRESRSVNAKEDSGQWSVKVGKSSWVALLVRGRYKDKPEIIAAHSSPVMITLDDSPFFAAADGMTILEQIEGSLAYLDTVGTRADDKRYKRMRMVLVSAHRELHNRMHRSGHYHEHNPVTDHEEHH